MKPYTETLLRAALIACMKEENQRALEGAEACKIDKALSLATMICITVPGATANMKALAAITAQAHTENEDEHDSLKSEIEEITKP